MHASDSIALELVVRASKALVAALLVDNTAGHWDGVSALMALSYAVKPMTCRRCGSGSLLVLQGQNKTRSCNLCKGSFVSGGSLADSTLRCDRCSYDVCSNCKVSFFGGGRRCTFDSKGVTQTSRIVASAMLEGTAEGLPSTLVRLACSADLLTAFGSTWLLKQLSVALGSPSHLEEQFAAASCWRSVKSMQRFYQAGPRSARH